MPKGLDTEGIDMSQLAPATARLDNHYGIERWGEVLQHMWGDEMSVLQFGDDPTQLPEGVFFVQGDY